MLYLHCSVSFKTRVLHKSRVVKDKAADLRVGSLTKALQSDLRSGTAESFICCWSLISRLTNFSWQVERASLHAQQPAVMNWQSQSAQCSETAQLSLRPTNQIFQSSSTSCQMSGSFLFLYRYHYWHFHTHHDHCPQLTSPLPPCLLCHQMGFEHA